MTATAAETLSVVAVSPAMQGLLRLATRLADADSAVLVQGESGTGKDLIAHWVHIKGARRDGPFIKVHCPSIPEDLLESELFGHEKGAFTDARQTKTGKIELAAGGTLFFDQVEDLSLTLQAKLLRVVEERRFERLGGTRTLEVDVRFVSASGPDLAAAVAAGRFRSDLYHRLGVVPLTVPPLRERLEEVMPLAEAFLARERERRATRAQGFDGEAATLLRGYGWPGNVRELRSVVERSALNAGATTITPAHLPAEVREQKESLWLARRPSLRELEKSYIQKVLAEVEGSQTRAAAILGISRKALWEKRRRYGIP
jgi:DNA-binding NtrC family response regulator